MTNDLVFYTNPMSRGRIVRWMLEEVGQPYRTVLLEYGTTMKAPEFRAINPMGKVPAITHRGVAITEAAAICAYLADAFPGANLATPHNSPQRGPYYRWLFFGAGPIEAATTNANLGVSVPTDKTRMAGYGTMADVLDTLEQTLTQTEYLAGPTFTAADLYVASHLGWGMMFGSIEKRPAFTEYAERMRNRPASQRAEKIDNALMPKQPAA